MFKQFFCLSFCVQIWTTPFNSAEKWRFCSYHFLAASFFLSSEKLFKDKDFLDFLRWFLQMLFLTRIMKGNIQTKYLIS